MARPQRNNVDYFPFFCEEGKKMFYLEETYGNDGFAVFVKILRELAKTDYHYLNLSDKTTTMFLSAKCKVKIEVLESIINDLVELEKFDSKLWRDCRVIWCQDFVDSIQDAYNKRSNECITYEGLRSLLVSLDILKPIKSKSKGDIKPQTKLKETKGKENKVNIPEFSEFLKYAKSKEPLISEKHLKLKYDAWNENGWKNGNDKPIKNWKSSLLNTIPHIEKRNSNNPDVDPEKPFKSKMVW